MPKKEGRGISKQCFHFQHLSDAGHSRCQNCHPISSYAVSFKIILNASKGSRWWAIYKIYKLLLAIPNLVSKVVNVLHSPAHANKLNRQLFDVLTIPLPSQRGEIFKRIFFINNKLVSFLTLQGFFILVTPEICNVPMKGHY